MNNIKQKLKIYLSGGMGKFGAEHFSEGNAWRVDISDKLSYFSDTNISCINPNNYYNFLDDSAYESNKEIMEFDLYKLKTCDFVIVNFNDINSLGTMAELAIAYELKMPIIGLCEDNNQFKLHPWQENMCMKIFTDRDDLIKYVIDFMWN